MMEIFIGILFLLLISIIMTITYTVIYFAFDFLKATKKAPQGIENILPKEMLDEIMREAHKIKEEQEENEEVEDDEDMNYSYYA